MSVFTDAQVKKLQSYCFTDYEISCYDNSRDADTWHNEAFQKLVTSRKAWSNALRKAGWTQKEILAKLAARYMKQKARQPWDFFRDEYTAQFAKGLKLRDMAKYTDFMRARELLMTSKQRRAGGFPKGKMGSISPIKREHSNYASLKANRSIIHNKPR